MRLNYIFPCLPILISQCASAKSNTMPILVDNQSITIIGKPVNTKMGAAVQNADGVFYLRNLSEWAENQTDTIQISGLLKIENIQQNLHEPIKTQATGLIYWIENYKIL